MNLKKQHWTLYFITATIVLTIAVQLYWNYNNYLDNKQRVQNEIQSSLDIAIDEYYTDLSKSNFFTIIDYDSINIKSSFLKDVWNEDINSSKSKVSISSIKISSDYKGNVSSIPKILDSIFITDTIEFEFNDEKITPKKLTKYQPEIQKFKINSDSLKFLKGIQSVAIALNNDEINFTRLDSIFTNQLSKKGIKTPHYLVLLEKDIKVGGSNKAKDIELSLFSNSKSTFLRPDQNLRAYYEDPTIQALKKSSTGILLSLLLSLSVIFCLIYLLKIISTQKELAEIKNDLINNITHEFKTPIATISTAVEAIESFNVIDNKEKTKKYAAISAFQIKKLHVMVEKLLETATLDSESLMLQKEPTNIVDLIAKIAKKFELLAKKDIKFTTNIDSKILKIDLFHFENAISNLVDNAIKYGGDSIEINLNSVLNVTEISVADNGKGIDKSQQERIFDKFYRVPKGNTHDVKGFGIGLYYTQKIIGKHNGSINVSSSFNNTIFKLQIPNE
ncbi:HAMP domain-containing histidine kinase [Flavobacteriaceae bacterium]|jgi:two-component system phosphate regulon sensor histidine kinase PhoR|nr:HAMP domain-containing histidine kinase [Flavobacteriaceae bacterium]